jgi:hypothetical protein
MRGNQGVKVLTLRSRRALVFALAIAVIWQGLTPAPAAASNPIVSGTVTSSTGAPLPGAYVHIFSTTDTWLAYDETDGSGNYSIQRPAGSYKLFVQAMELSHEPIPFRSGGTDVVPRWPQDHAAVDPFRRPGY